MEDPSQLELIQEKKIHKLPDQTIRRIKSEQVVVDLVSCVKELIENSIDAGATEISVFLEDGGMKTIRVEDNGCGIPRACHDTFALMHHTSKITNFEDLAKVLTYGFRGEALPSICAIAEAVQVTTRTENEPATKLDLNSLGAPLNQNLIERLQGTTVTIQAPFSRFPVRREALVKAKTTQTKKIHDLICSYAIARPEVAFYLSCPPRPVFKKQAFDSILDVLTHLYGKPTVAELSSYQVQASGFRLFAFLPKPNTTDRQKVFRSSNDRSFHFVNGRPVDLPRELKLINKVLRKFFSLSSKTFPFVVLSVHVDPSVYDINYMPSKRKIVFTDTDALLNVLSTELLKPNYPCDFSLEEEQENMELDSSDSLTLSIPIRPSLAPMTDDNLSDPFLSISSQTNPNFSFQKNFPNSSDSKNNSISEPKNNSSKNNSSKNNSSKNNSSNSISEPKNNSSKNNFEPKNVELKTNSPNSFDLRDDSPISFEPRMNQSDSMDVDFNEPLLRTSSLNEEMTLEDVLTQRTNVGEQLTDLEEEFRVLTPARPSQSSQSKKITKTKKSPKISSGQTTLVDFGIGEPTETEEPSKKRDWSEMTASGPSRPFTMPPFKNLTIKVDLKQIGAKQSRTESPVTVASRDSDQTKIQIIQPAHLSELIFIGPLQGFKDCYLVTLHSQLFRFEAAQAAKMLAIDLIELHSSFEAQQMFAKLTQSNTFASLSSRIFIAVKQ